MRYLAFFQLRNLAFKKIPQKSGAPPPCMTLSGVASELLSPTSGDHSIPSGGWQQWKQKDEQVREKNRSQSTCARYWGQYYFQFFWVELRGQQRNSLYLRYISFTCSLHRSVLYRKLLKGNKVKGFCCCKQQNKAYLMKFSLSQIAVYLEQIMSDLRDFWLCSCTCAFLFPLRWPLNFMRQTWKRPWF